MLLLLCPSLSASFFPPISDHRQEVPCETTSLRERRNFSPAADVTGHSAATKTPLTFRFGSHLRSLEEQRSAELGLRGAGGFEKVCHCVSK